MEKWQKFYEPFFGKNSEVEEFVAQCERQTPPANTAKIMMHQTQRLVTLADDIPKIRPPGAALQVLFLLICAEHIAKLHDNYDGDGQSRNYVRKFFEHFLSDYDKKQISDGLTDHQHKPLDLRGAVDTLYSIRCNVVHEGRLWSMSFAFADGTPVLTVEPDIIVRLDYDHLRGIVVRGCIKAIAKRLEKP